MGGEVVGTGGGNSGLVNRDHGAVGEGLETVESRGVSGTIDSGSSIGVHSANNTLGGQVVGTGGGNSGLISGDHGAVGVGNQLGVEVQGAVVAIAVGNRGGSHSGSSSVGHRGGGVGNRGSGSISVTLGGQVVSTGGGNSGLVNRDHGAVGVGDQLEVEVEGASVAVGRGVARVASVGNRGSVIASVSHSGGSSNRGSGIASIANSGGSSIANWGNSSLEGQVISTGSGHGGLINWDNSAIGEGLESIEALGGSGGNASGENLK